MGDTMRFCRFFQWFGITLIIVACGDSGPVGTPQDVQTVAAEPPDSQPCELVMGWDPWEPYQYEIASGHVFGLDVDLLTAVVQNAGCDISFRKGSWRDLLHQLQDGEIDLLAGATQTPGREQFAYFTDPYRVEEFYLYVARDRLQELEDLSFEQLMDQGLRIGVIDDYLYADEILSYQDNPDHQDQFAYSSIAEINVSRLLDHKVDAIIEDKFVGASIIRHKNLNKLITPHPLRFDTKAVSIMISRVSVDEELFGRINQSVQELKGSGAIDKVLAQYQNP